MLSQGTDLVFFNFFIKKIFSFFKTEYCQFFHLITTIFSRKARLHQIFIINNNYSTYYITFSLAVRRKSWILFKLEANRVKRIQVLLSRILTRISFCLRLIIFVLRGCWRKAFSLYLARSFRSCNKFLRCEMQLICFGLYLQTFS